ncbi:MAG: P-II family nitrogen regulator [Ruminococcaceae bacterium]|nr:P-II family nitrogen regulator [Oscillospiraceae bacterium]
MTTNNHEVIFAIVNAGYAEDAMDVAREHGAQGGTIINGRGVAREKDAAFFGITIHSDKEILMIVVEKDIRDQVLHALYQQMGMQKQAQGIVFSLPVSDVAGLVKRTEETKTKQD